MFKKVFLSSVACGAILSAAPAEAQSIPAECSVQGTLIICDGQIVDPLDYVNLTSGIDIQIGTQAPTTWDTTNIEEPTVHLETDAGDINFLLGAGSEITNVDSFFRVPSGVSLESGSGNISIVNRGRINGYASGISTRTRGGNIGINSYDVFSMGIAIFANIVDAPGDISIEVNGNTSSGWSDGIYARIQESAENGNIDLVINGFVSASSAGIVAVNESTGNTTITVNENVSGYEDDGIFTSTLTGANVFIAEGVTVTGRRARRSFSRGSVTLSSIDSEAPASNVLTVAGILDGTVRLGDGDDVVTFLETSQVALGRGEGVLLGGGNDILYLNTENHGALLGGDGIDTLVASGAGWVLSNQNIIDFENIELASGSWVLFGPDLLNLNIGQSSELNIFDAVTISNDLTNSGVLRIAGANTAALSIGGDFTQSATGVLHLDVLSATDFDQLIVDGSANLAGTLNVNNLGFTPGVITLIDATAINGQFDQVNFNSIETLLFSNAIEYDTANGNVNLVSAAVDANTIAGLTPNQAAAANGFTSAALSGGANPALSTVLINTSSISDVSVLSRLLEELHPEEVAGGLETFRNTHRAFVHDVLMKNDYGDEGPRLWTSLPYYQSSIDGSFGSEFEADTFSANFGMSGYDVGPVDVGFAIGYGQQKGELNAGAVDTVESQYVKVAGSVGMDTGDFGRLAAAVSYASGQTDIRRQVVAPEVQLNERQNGDADISTVSGLARFSLNDLEVQGLSVEPFLQAGFDVTQQSSFTVGTEAVALDISEYDGSRTSLGAGLNLGTQFGDKLLFDLTGQALTHQGDTEINLISSFSGSSAPVTGFETRSIDVKNQFLVNGELGFLPSKNTKVTLGGFGEFGDIESYGGRVRLATRF